MLRWLASDLNGFFILKRHYDAAAVAEFNRGIDELQAIPVRDILLARALTPPSPPEGTPGSAALHPTRRQRCGETESAWSRSFTPGGGEPLSISTALLRRD